MKCIACSVDTWEKSAQASKKKYRLSIEEQNKGTCFLRCTNCYNHLCNLCADLFCSKIESFSQNCVPPWCRVLRNFVDQANEQKTGYIKEICGSDCFSCRMKIQQQIIGAPSTAPGTTAMSVSAPLVTKMLLETKNGKNRPNKAQAKRRRLKDKYSAKKKQTVQFPLDGSFFFPDIGVLIQSDTKHFDSLSVAKQGCKGSRKDDALPHMNITPVNAFELEEQGFSPQGCHTAIEMHRSVVDASYPHPCDPRQLVSLQVQVIVIDSSKAAELCGTTKEPGCDWVEGKEIQRAVAYLTDSHITEAKKQGIDAIAIFASPQSAQGDFHGLTIRWLCKQVPNLTYQELHDLYEYFFGLLSTAKGQMELSRVGGSNGIAHISKEFFAMLHLKRNYSKKIACSAMVSIEDQVAIFLHQSLQQDKETMLPSLLSTYARWTSTNHEVQIQESTGLL